MARRPILGRPTAATVASVTDNFSLLGISSAEKDAFFYLRDLDSLQAAVTDLNSHAGEALKGVDDTIQHACRLGSVWQLLEMRGRLDKDPWTVDIGPTHAIKLSDLIEITLPAQTRGGQRRPEHQRDLVQWDEPRTGQTMPPLTERHGVLPFRYLRQNQRARLLDYSVPHLGQCSRIFGKRDQAKRAVTWVQAAVTDGRLTGRPRKAEGIEYVNDCLRIRAGYDRGFKKNRSEEEGLEEAQKALAPRGGGRTGVSTTEVRNRLFVLSAHLLSTVSKLGVESPFSKLFSTVRYLDRWSQMTPYGAVDMAAMAELASLAGPQQDTLLSEMAFPAAERLYSMPLPPAPEQDVTEVRPEDTMTQEEVDAANMLGGGAINAPERMWYEITARPARIGTTPAPTPTSTTQRKRAGRRRAGAEGYTTRASANQNLRRLQEQGRATAEARVVQRNSRFFIDPPPNGEEERQARS